MRINRKAFGLKRELKRSPKSEVGSDNEDQAGDVQVNRSRAGAAKCRPCYQDQ